MAAPIQKYLDQDLYISAEVTDNTRVTPAIMYNGDGLVLTASGYVDPSTIPAGGILDQVNTNRITPVIIVDENTVPYPQP